MNALYQEAAAYAFDGVEEVCWTVRSAQEFEVLLVGELLPAGKAHHLHPQLLLQKAPQTVGPRPRGEDRSWHAVEGL